LKTILWSAIFLASVRLAAAEQISQELASAGLIGKLVEQVKDNGFVVEIIVRCSPGSIGIIHYDKSERTFLSSKGKSHDDFLESWISTCNSGSDIN